MRIRQASRGVKPDAARRGRDHGCAPAIGHEYNDVTHYRPETKATNQSHDLEAPDHVDHWADLES